ncbi:MAG: hypothetical protein HYZ17_17355 [Betaproteobacteria bacterium]|nr:hypothetical protein [Betaproteobacteria bacterium]
MSFAAILGALGLAAVWAAVLAWSNWNQQAQESEGGEMLGAESLYPAERFRVDDPSGK